MNSLTLVTRKGIVYSGYGQYAKSTIHANCEGGEFIVKPYGNLAAFLGPTFVLLIFPARKSMEFLCKFNNGT